MCLSFVQDTHVSETGGSSQPLSLREGAADALSALQVCVSNFIGSSEGAA